jgi:hypothetical protein
MTKQRVQAGVLVTRLVSPKQALRLKKKLLVTKKALNHLKQKKVISAMKMREAGCCKPDGGTCCVNKRAF